MKCEPIKINDEIRRAVRDSRLSRAAICRAAGIDQGLLSNFMAGRRRLGVADMSRLADALGMELIVRPLPGRRRRKGAAKCSRR